MKKNEKNTEKKELVKNLKARIIKRKPASTDMADVSAARCN